MRSEEVVVGEERREEDVEEGMDVQGRYSVQGEVMRR
jgi:hypothetical protein